MSRFVKEMPPELLDGYEQALQEKTKMSIDDTNYKYGSNYKSNVKSHPISSKQPVSAGFAFRTADSFLNSLNNKKTNVDLSQYKAGLKVYHKKFGEGVINSVEPEGEDLKVDINFEKAGHKRLMAKYANLEIL